MTDGATALGASVPARPARSLAVSRSHLRRRLARDRWARRLVVAGGIVIVATILAILVVIAVEVAPLARSPSAVLVGTRGAGEGSSSVAVPGAGMGVDEYRELAYEVTSTGFLRVVSLTGRAPVSPIPIAGLGGAAVTTVATAGRGRHLVGTGDGRIIPLEVKFDVAFTGGARTVSPEPVFGDPVTLDPVRRRPVVGLAFAATESGPVTVAQFGPAELVLHSIVERKALVGASRREELLTRLDVPVDEAVTAIGLDGRGDDLFLGTARGWLLRYDVRARERPEALEAVASGGSPETPITAFGFLIGDRTLVAGDARGRVSSWQVVPNAPGGQPRLTPMHEFAAHPGPIVAIAASPRDKGFVTADGSGQLRVHYGTSGATLLSLSAPNSGIRSVIVSPKADGMLALDRSGVWAHWQLHNPHPEVTLRTLFGKVWYEGYPGPAHVWQSTGGTDDFEPKFGLVPLIFGTVKGTLYAMLFAVPLALLGALYVSEFMHPTLKGRVKPVVEIMAALPSVVLGFLAGLWLAPRIERLLSGLFLMPVALAVSVLAAFALWRVLPAALRGRVRTGTEALLLMPVAAVGAWGAFSLGGIAEALLLGADLRGWLLSALGLAYDQRNAMVVGVAMGFAVIPIVFTIAEDSLANVPQHLRAGSLALGATRWQTALRVVLPTASPGIFSAVMIGFGRAVGETMIVLMATGNTPVMDWSPFNGFRALSANIAVELPEAPEGGTLFRVLFLAALLLFCLTFTVNTVAELVRQRLRERYRSL